ncbi:response regulator, partial [Vibrio parahaemolyticus V-223/04]
RCAKFCKVVM